MVPSYFCEYFCFITFPTGKHIARPRSGFALSHTSDDERHAAGAKWIKPPQHEHCEQFSRTRNLLRDRHAKNWCNTIVRKSRKASYVQSSLCSGVLHCAPQHRRVVLWWFSSIKIPKSLDGLAMLFFRLGATLIERFSLFGSFVFPETRATAVCTTKQL